jgi:hypothetical protein
VRRLRRVEESTTSSRISPPGVGELSRRFGNTMVSIFKENGAPLRDVHPQHPPVYKEVNSKVRHIDGDALEDGDHNVPEMSGQLTQARQRYTRRCR